MIVECSCPGAARRYLLALMSVIALSVPAPPAESSGPSVQLQPVDVPAGTKGGPVSFAEIARTVPEIVLSVEDVKVAVSRVGKNQDISVASNCPAHWNVSGHVIRQVGLSTTRKGVSLKADGAGAQVTVNGKIYALPRDSDGVIRSLKVENGVVTINGQKLEPLPGSDKPGDCTGPDVLEVRVPDSYQGGLFISCRGASDVVVDNWKGGSLTASLNGQSKLKTGKLNGLAKAVVDVQGDSKAQIDGLSAKAFVANITGAGRVVVNGGNAEMSNATISGSGSMTLRGKFRNLKKSVQGEGTIEVAE